MPIYKAKTKKDGKQGYRVRVNFTDKSGKARQVERTAYGAAEAKQLEVMLKREYGSDTPDSARLTVGVLAAAYLQAKSHETRATSHAKTCGIVEQYILPAFGDVRLDRLSAPALQEWKNALAARNLSPTTLKNIYAVFRSLLNYAVRMEYLSRNPLNAVGNFKTADFTPPQDKLHYYTPQQFLAYAAAARAHAEACETVREWGYYVFFVIAYYTGMRKGEINALKWSDAEGGMLHVRRSVTQKIKGNAVVETPPKNKSSYRTLQIPEPLAEVLDAQRARQKAAGGWNPDFRICGGEHCLPDSSLEKRNTEFAAAAGLPHIRIHDFRHSHASLLANEGINIQEIARRLGHARIEQTWNTYAHLYPREEERAVAVLNRIQSKTPAEK